MYSRNIVILANSKKIGGRCVAGKDIDTGEWVRIISSKRDPRFIFITVPFTPEQLNKLSGVYGGPHLLSIYRIPFLEKCPLYCQPENERITGELWTRLESPPDHDFIKIEKAIKKYEDKTYPWWLGDKTADEKDHISEKFCNQRLPLSCSLFFKKLSKKENNPKIKYVQRLEAGQPRIQPRLSFILNKIHYDLAITDIRYIKAIQHTQQIIPEELPDAYVTIGVGQMYEEKKAHYKLVVAVITGN